MDVIPVYASLAATGTAGDKLERTVEALLPILEHIEFRATDIQVGIVISTPKRRIAPGPSAAGVTGVNPRINPGTVWLGLDLDEPIPGPPYLILVEFINLAGTAQEGWAFLSMRDKSRSEVDVLEDMLKELKKQHA